MSLVIERLHSRFRSETPLAPARCEAWQSMLAAEDGDALAAGLTRDEEWLLIRRLPLAMRWRADAGDAEIGLHWRQALRQALEQAMSRPDDAGIIRYASRREAVTDLLYRSALGERERQWAWQRMGLIARGELGAADALAAGVAILLREPELVWPVLHRIVAAEAATAALTALLRALPAASWQRLLHASPRTAPYAGIVASPAATAAAGAHASALQNDAALPTSGEAHDLLNWAAARPHFAVRHADTLAILIAALAWPAIGTVGSDLRPRVAALVERLAVLTGKRPARDRDAGATGAPAAALPAITAPAMRDEAALPRLPALPGQFEWQQTRWAGALFWLGRLSATDMLAWLESAQHANALPLLLRALAETLGVPADDAALAAFCGGSVPQVEPPPAFTARAETQVAHWSNWLDDAAPELPEPRMAAVCQRSGRLRCEPGWIELHLPLASVDTTIRRLGLDLDPGWLPWLGCVLRIHYDE